jgi:sugar O-acyltransferase (sialic acid O-acetyltransferase NeuD family)
MANSEIKVERSAANDERVKVIELLVNQNEFVSLHQPIALIEGSKAIFELTSSGTGFINLLFSENDYVEVGTTFAEVSDDIESYKLTKNISASTKPFDKPEHFTSPAFELLKSLNLNTNDFSDYELVTTDIIQSFQIKQLNELITSQKDILTKKNKEQKILIVGAGKAAGQLLSVFHKKVNCSIIGFVDDTEEKQNSFHMGYPVLGKIIDIEDVLKKHSANTIICSIGNLTARKKVVEIACKLAIPLANAIHPSVIFDENVNIGTGNYIGPNCFIGTNTTIGFGSFISSNTVIEHDSQIGNCISTGPSVSLSGSVNIESGCILGSSIVIEPYVHIGQNSSIASGCVITQSIKANSQLKMKTNYTLL